MNERHGSKGEDGMTMNELLKRPRMCPSPNTCTSLHGLSEKQGLAQCEPGDSFVCFGKMSTEFEYEFEGVEHCNPLCSCHYTPRTGLIRFYETPDDWYLLSKAYAKARSSFEQHSNAEKAEADERKGQ